MKIKSQNQASLHRLLKQICNSIDTFIFLATLYTTEDLVGVWRGKSGNKNFDCRSISEETLQCNGDSLYEITILAKDGETILTSWVGSKGTFDGKAKITWKTVKNVEINWLREG